MKKMNSNLLRGMALAMALIVMMAGTAPMQTQAAARKITVKVKSPKTGADLYKNKLVILGKKKTQLSVKCITTKKVKRIASMVEVDGKIQPWYVMDEKSATADVTSKAAYRSSKPKVVSVNKKGKLTVKSYGSATITVKYKGMSKKLKVTVKKNHKHSWKAHSKVKKVLAMRTRCACGALRDGMSYEEEYEHDLMHAETHTDGNYWWEQYPLNVKYIDYYICSCGARKKGQPEPKDGLGKEYYESKGYQTFKCK